MLASHMSLPVEAIWLFKGSLCVGPLVLAGWGARRIALGRAMPAAAGIWSALTAAAAAWGVILLLAGVFVWAMS